MQEEEIKRMVESEDREEDKRKKKLKFAMKRTLYRAQALERETKTKVPKNVEDCKQSEAVKKAIESNDVNRIRSAKDPTNVICNTSAAIKLVGGSS